MKKFFKVVGSLAAVGAAVAGGIALYNRYFASEDILDDFEDELDSEFEDDLEDEEAAKRSYTILTNNTEETETPEEEEKED